MSYLSALIAWFQIRSSELVGDPWWDAYLDKLVGVENWFYHLGWWIFGIVLGTAVILFVLSLLGVSSRRLRSLRSLASGSFGCGCAALILLFWPLLEYITLSLARGMASSFGPEGTINQGKFVMSLVLYILLGAG